MAQRRRPRQIITRRRLCYLWEPLLRLIVLALALCVAGRSPAWAQIVNVQGALAKAPDENGLSGQVELKVNWREGNNPILDLGGGGSIVVREGRLLGLVVARGGYGRSRGVTFTKRSFEHVRARVTLSCVWRWEAFGQHEFDEFRRLSLRALLGTGPALQIVNTRSFALLAGAAYMLELERLDERIGTTDSGGRSHTQRASAYLSGRGLLANGHELVQTVYAQPRLVDPSDVRLLAEVAVQSKLSAHFALKNSITVAYDATPPDQVKELDTAIEVAFAVHF
ncbi:MAG: DUF481 domain-containing protein [Kofleriaceae bacterium]|nr:DUF481 domain-containing protein [Kofleriaceae bacterium]